MSEWKHNPGSDEALDLGCTCSVIDNGHGYGARGREGRFWITAGCPLHDNNNLQTAEFGRSIRENIELSKEGKTAWDVALKGSKPPPKAAKPKDTVNV